MTMPKFDPVAFYIQGISVVTTKADFAAYASASGLPVTDLHTADQLTEAYEAGVASLDAEVNDWRSQAHRSQSEADNAIAECDQLRAKLAAEQAKNVGMRELVEHFALIDLGRSLLPDDFGLWVLRARKAIATPSDTSSLEAIVKKAGEVMRENCITAAGPEDSYQDDWIRAKIDACDAIRAIPAVTMEDLK